MPAVNLRRQPYDIYIGRPGPWGNPFKIGPGADRRQVIAKYRDQLIRRIKAGSVTLEQLAGLHGKKLGCYCKPQPCHGDVLDLAAEIAHRLLTTALPKDRPRLTAAFLAQFK